MMDQACRHVQTGAKDKRGKVQADLKLGLLISMQYLSFLFSHLSLDRLLVLMLSSIH